jgi:hypothetical protein
MPSHESQAGDLRASVDIAYIPVLVCALLSISLIRIGFLSFFFLVPLGFVAYGYNRRSAWFCVLAAIVGNAILAWGLLFGEGIPWLDMVYFTIMALIFVWISAPPAVFPRVPLAYRIIAGSTLSALLFFFIIHAAQADSVFNTFLRSQAEVLNSLYIASAGTDEVERSLLEEQSPDFILKTLSFVAMRGGALASSVLIFFVSRQLSLTCVGIIRRLRIGRTVIDFHAAPFLIWVLSGSLLVVLGATRFSLGVLEIIGWNMVTICALLYLAQGSGIALYILTRSAIPPILRLVINVLIIVVIFSPGINVIALGALLLLGIAENWAPFRAPKTNGHSSTPGNT